MLSKIYIVDFEDSFTYNIASTLYDYCQDLQVVTHEVFFNKDFLERLTSTSEARAVILGPGPGHPNQYQMYFKEIESLRICNNIFLMGICLGHQILGLMDGHIVREALELCHGQSVPVEFNQRVYQVQRYNSLAVFDSTRDEEINIRYFTNGVSYQFHPESVGTEENIDFFKALISFID